MQDYLVTPITKWCLRLKFKAETSRALEISIAGGKPFKCWVDSQLARDLPKLHCQENVNVAYSTLTRMFS